MTACRIPIQRTDFCSLTIGIGSRVGAVAALTGGE